MSDSYHEGRIVSPLILSTLPIAHTYRMIEESCPRCLCDCVKQVMMRTDKKVNDG